MARREATATLLSRFPGQQPGPVALHPDVGPLGKDRVQMGADGHPQPTARARAPPAHVAGAVDRHVRQRQLLEAALHIGRPLRLLESRGGYLANPDGFLHDWFDVRVDPPEGLHDGRFERQPRQIHCRAPFPSAGTSRPCRCPRASGQLDVAKSFPRP